MGALAEHHPLAPSARERLFELLADLRPHSWRECELVAGNRYAARALELRRLGYVIESEPIDDGKAYRLVSLTPGAPKGKQVKVFLDEADAKALVGGDVTDEAKAATLKALLSFQANRGKL